LEAILRITSRRALAGLAIVGAGALALAGCAAPPEEGGSGDGEAIDFLPCMVSDAGGFDDKSFNQSGFEGLTAAADELGTDYTEVESADESAYGPNVQNLVDQGCNLIVTVGFLLAETTLAQAEANPDVEFAIIDDQLDADFDGETDVENGKPIVFNTHEAAFLAGYAAASYSTTGVVGTFGGIQIPTVTIFMDGFAEGVGYYNEQKSADVQVLGWDVENQTGLFTGGFEAGTDALAVAQGLLEQNADVIMPVGGPIYQSAAQAIRTADSGAVLVGVDSDVFESDETVSDLILTSVQKGITSATKDVIVAAANGDFDNTKYVGTLENDGVGLAPFHDYEDQVDPALADEIEEIKAGIIDGSIVVESDAAFATE
jgi:basic membrane protein A and related proteins